MKDEYTEFKHYIEMSPDMGELYLTRGEIMEHSRLTDEEKRGLYELVRARSSHF